MILMIYSGPTGIISMETGCSVEVLEEFNPLNASLSPTSVSASLFQKRKASLKDCC